MDGFRALAELAQLGASAVLPGQLAERALQIALDAVGAEGGDLCLLAGYQRHVLHSHWPELSPAELRSPPPPDPSIDELLDKRQARAWPTADAPPSLCTPARTLGYATCASTPILAGGRAVGVLDVAARRPDAFDARALEVFTAVGALLGPILDQALGVTANPSHEAAQSVLELRALQRVAETVSRSLDLDEVLGRCLDMALQVAHAPAGAIYLRDDRRALYLRVVARNVPTDVAPDQFPARGADERFRKGPPQLIDVDDVTETAPTVQAARRHGFRRIIIMPLRVEGRLVGLLGLDFHEPMTFVPSTVLTLEAIAGQEAVAIENARAHRLVEVRARLALILREFGERVLVPGEGVDIYDLILDTARKLTRSDRGLIARATPAGVKVIAGLGKDTALVGNELPFDAPYLRDAAVMTVPLVVEDTSALDPETVIGQVARQNQTTSFVLMAMRHRGTPLGYLFVGSGEPRRYDYEEIEAMQILSSMAAEVIERARVQSVIEAERHRLETTIEHLPVVVAVINNRGEVLNLNAAGRAFADTMGRALGGDWRLALSELRYHFADGRPIPPMELPAVMAFGGQTPAPLEMIVSNHDGTRRLAVMAVAAPLSRAADGTVEAVVTGFQDVTALRELADAKDRFLRVASHELRSPITSLRATTSLLEMDPTAITDEKRRATMLQRIQRQVDRLIRLVEQLIDSARLNAKEVPIHPVECDLVALARESIALACSDVPTRKVTLTGDETLVGQWDPLRIEQVLTNLISNAIRYSPAEREITVSARAEGPLALVDVTDFGIGVPEDQVDKMFSPFFRATNAVSLHRGGLGLGLHIASELVRRHGGQIRVVSRQNEGSTFTVELPRARP